MSDEDAERIESGRLLFAAETRFVYASQSLNQLPVAVSPEIAFAGRSNVGKSSLINALTGQHGLARASGQPGRTRQLNFFSDGYAQAPKSVKADWQGLMFEFLRGRPELRRVVLLLDARIEVKGADNAVMDLLDDAAVTYQLVLTKADGVKPAPLARKQEEIAALARKHPAAYPVILTTSGVTGLGVAELRAELAQLAG